MSDTQPPSRAQPRDLSAGHALRAPGEHLAAIKAEQEERQRALYGDALADVTYLRTRGFVIVADGDGIEVDGRLKTRAEVKALAARERNVAGDTAPAARRVVTTASGLRVGQKVAMPQARAPVLPQARPRPVESAGARNPGPRALSGAVAAAVAKAAEHSTDLGPRPRVVWLDLALLVVDGSYQRDVGKVGNKHVNELRRAWNWNCYQPVIVSERADGRYAVIDGQHRLLAAKGHPLISELPCYIVDAPEAAAQAAIFSVVNGRRLALTSQQKFWAAHAAGDRVAVTCVRLCEKAGVTILRAPPSSDIPPRAILGPATLQRLVVRLGEWPCGEALALLAETHPETVNAFRAPTVAALCRIAADKPYSGSRWRAVLATVDLDQFYVDIVAEHCAGCSQYGQQSRQWRDAREGDAAGVGNSSEGVAVADGARLSWGGDGGDTGRRQEPDGYARLGERELFAPSPGDLRWAGIVSRRPDLAPAIEPSLRVLADGLACPLDESRADQLRCSGNGVVALQAAVAVVELVRRVTR